MLNEPLVSCSTRQGSQTTEVLPISTLEARHKAELFQRRLAQDKQQAMQRQQQKRSLQKEQMGEQISLFKEGVRAKHQAIMSFEQERVRRRKEARDRRQSQSYMLRNSSITEKAKSQVERQGDQRALERQLEERVRQQQEEIQYNQVVIDTQTQQSVEPLGVPADLDHKKHHLKLLRNFLESTTQFQRYPHL